MPRLTRPAPFSAAAPGPAGGRPKAARQGAKGLAAGALGRTLLRSWARILLPTLAVGAATLAVVQALPPRYTGEAKLLLEAREGASGRGGERGAPLDDQAVASQAQVAMSRDLAREAVRRLNLVGNPEFDASVAEPGLLDRALALAGIGRDRQGRSAEERVLDAYSERLSVQPAGRSRVLSVAFTSRDPELAAAGANAAAELYLASLQATRLDSARNATTWLGGSVETLRNRAAEAEAKAEAYRVKHGLAAAGGAGQPLTGQQLADLSNQLAQARTQRADLTGRVKAIKEMIKDGRAFEIPDVADNDLIRRTVESRIALRARLALESQTLLPAHPRIKELTAQIAELDGQIKAAAERIGRTLENDARIAGARAESLQAAVDGQRDVVAKGTGSEAQLRALEREAKAQRDQLETVLARLRDAAIRDGEGALPADARLVSRAVAPQHPSFPDRLTTLALAMLAAFLVSTALALAGRRRPEPVALRTEETAEAAPQAQAREPFLFPEAAPPVFRAFPDPAEAEAARIAAEAPAPVTEAEPAGIETAAAEPARVSAPAKASSEPETAQAEAADPLALASLIGRLEAGPREAAGRTVLVVELTPRDAAASLGENLARTLAERGPALCVDLSTPALDGDAPGLTDLVAGTADFVDAIQPAEGSRLHRIGRGFVETEILDEEPESLAICLEAMPEAYPWVVCRMGALDEAVLEAIAAHMDSVVLVSDAPADDLRLVALYGVAEAAGAGQVLVARGPGAPRAAAAETAPEAEEPMRLRLSAA